MNVPEELLALVDQRIRAASAVTRAIGTCVERAAIGPGAQVTFDGSDTAVPVKVLGHVMLRPGHRCVLDKYGTEWLVTGAFASPTLGYANAYLFGPSGGISTTSATYVDMTSMPTLSFTKYHDNTHVEIDQSVEAFCNTSATGGRWGLRFVQTDGDLPYTPVDYNGANIWWTNVAHLDGRAMFRISSTGFPAGQYTITWRWRRTGGAGAPSTNEIDLHSLVVREMVHPASPNL